MHPGRGGGGRGGWTTSCGRCEQRCRRCQRHGGLVLATAGSVAQECTPASVRQDSQRLRHVSGAGRGRRSERRGGAGWVVAAPHGQCEAGTGWGPAGAGHHVHDAGGGVGELRSQGGLQRGHGGLGDVGARSLAHRVHRPPRLCRPLLCTRTRHQEYITHNKG